MHAADAPYPFVFFVLHPFLFAWFVSQLNKFELKSRLSRFVAEEPVDVPLPREEAVRLSTEAFRLWAVAAGYGQACDLYRYSAGLDTWGRGHNRAMDTLFRGAERALQAQSAFPSGCLTSLSPASCSKTQFLRAFVLCISSGCSLSPVFKLCYFVVSALQWETTVAF